MCGTYHLELDESLLGKKIRQRAQELSLFDFKQGDVFPGDKILCIVPKKQGVTLKIMNWGLKTSHGLVYNGRMETLDNTFSFHNNRCIIPVSYFYEFNNHRRFTIKRGTDLMFLAGCYNNSQELIIITGQAENELKGIHHRTPIILDKNQMLNYLKFNFDLIVDNKDLIIELG